MVSRSLSLSILLQFLGALEQYIYTMLTLLSPSGNKDKFSEAAKEIVDFELSLSKVSSSHKIRQLLNRNVAFMSVCA